MPQDVHPVEGILEDYLAKHGGEVPLATFAQYLREQHPEVAEVMLRIGLIFGLDCVMKKCVFETGNDGVIRRRTGREPA